jgi:hypothetical protein
LEQNLHDPALIGSTIARSVSGMARAEAGNDQIWAEVAAAWPHDGSPDCESRAAAVAAMAERQLGLVTRSQLRAAGMPAATITRWAVDGRLHRVHRGVFAVGHARRDADARWMAAVLAAGPGAALSHRSSGELQAILLVDDLVLSRAAIHLTRPGHAARREGLIIHGASLAAVDLTTHRGVPTTTATRALYDLSPSLTSTERSKRPSIEGF